MIFGEREFRIVKMKLDLMVREDAKGPKGEFNKSLKLFHKPAKSSTIFAVQHHCDTCM